MLKNALTVVVTCLILLIMVEAGARFYQYEVRNRTIEDTLFHPLYRDYFFFGTNFRPGAGGSWQAIPEMEINSLGFRGPEIDIDNEAGHYRIVTLGGSTSHAGNYPRKLEGLLNAAAPLGERRIEVINAAVPTWNTTQSLIQFVTRVAYLNPDMVLVYHAINDRANSDTKWLTDLPEVDYRKYGSTLTWNLVSWNFLVNRLRHFQTMGAVHQWQAELDTPLDFQTGYPDGSTRIVRSNLDSLLTLAESRGIVIGLITMPLNHDPADPPAEQRRRAGFAYADVAQAVPAVAEINELLRRLASRHNAVLVDAAAHAPLVDAANFSDLCHFTDAGATAFAAFVSAPVLQALHH